MKEEEKQEQIKNHKHFIEITAFLCSICNDYNADSFKTTLKDVKTPKGIIGNYKITIEKLN